MLVSPLSTEFRAAHIEWHLTACQGSGNPALLIETPTINGPHHPEIGVLCPADYFGWEAWYHK